MYIIGLLTTLIIGILGIVDHRVGFPNIFKPIKNGN